MKGAVWFNNGDDACGVITWNGVHEGFEDTAVVVGDEFICGECTPCVTCERFGFEWAEDVGVHDVKDGVDADCFASVFNVEGCFVSVKKMRFPRNCEVAGFRFEIFEEILVEFVICFILGSGSFCDFFQAFD